MSTFVAGDRLAALLAPGAPLNGIDFVEIASADQRTLRVHFLNTIAVAGSLVAENPVTITGGETIPTVRVLPTLTWLSDAGGRPLLELHVAAPGDFSTYTLTLRTLPAGGSPLAAPALDRFFDRADFSFKALCESNLDCETPQHLCPPAVGPLPPIDYLAKDFLSFRAALSDFSALRYPEWQERNESDFGTMFMEALCAVADDLSYLQDRIAAEATLETATQRRSIVRHARLVDYEPRPALSSRVLLQFDVSAPDDVILAGIPVLAVGADGTRIAFETGNGIGFGTAATAVSKRWNRSAALRPYLWDGRDQCLRAGATEAWIAGDGYRFVAGQQLLIDTRAAIAADPPTRQVVTLISIDETVDLLFHHPVTHIVWRLEDRLREDRDLGVDGNGVPRTLFAGNLVPATQGRTMVESFAIPADPLPPGNLAIVREGVRSGGVPSLQYLYTLAEAPLAWLPAADGQTFQPEIALADADRSWSWRRRIVDAAAGDPAFTVDPFRMRTIGRNSDGTLSHDYDGDDGESVRFGDGTFGAEPAEGAVFQLRYRVGDGSRGNVAADAITAIAPGASPFLVAVTNPFAAEGGSDAEPDERVRRMAPQAFRAGQFRAVRSEDYARAAETLPWVSKAGSRFRWTGSWLTAFTTADPRAAEEVSVDQDIELIDLLNRYRLAGYESYTLAPRFVSLDLQLTVCARSEAFRGDVERAVREALSTARFFHPDAFTFGTPLERSALETAVQTATGVGGILSIRFRRRGGSVVFDTLPDTLAVARDEILRVDNDPSRPERGSIHIRVEGGK
ncbi:MAG: hypothetical protein JWN02_776 [Acidobacteria bacterium]|nr:hypothetical protein [Acidobacteriota bacterium]